ncbi:MAG: bifunctional phosphopantothenoylcysteine decarboxylase/phosphopantothenate--cysteine ligase CoaBC [Pseudomonadales bacterium]|nr:bifunctional phosphopantothenoylcysteine decarboxylase/phosphopantothenate--cysteine ligase CoaBC [Pseudomonadales bacterium]
MNRLTNKQIILGVTGGIAAYKSAELVRGLQKAGANVRVVMTRSACEFITPLTLQALSGNPVHVDLLDTEAEAAMGHIELARWADLILIAPASASFISRLSCGSGDDLLSTLCLATDSQIVLAPAMNQAMWRDCSTQNNLELLVSRGVKVLGPDDGEQACGDVGPGRMLDVDQLLTETREFFQSHELNGRHVMITAGPTREAIDPVRYISNESSGKMGFAMAQAAVEAGAKVTLIAGPVQLETPDHVARVDVTSTAQMHQAVFEHLSNCDIFIGSAAVADYRPAAVAERKIKKGDQSMRIELVRNPDIIAEVAASTSRPFTVGFAAETHDLIEYAQKKLKHKNLDLIIANNVADKRIGFNSDDNEVTLISRNGSEVLPKMPKTKLARSLIDQLAQHYLSSLGSIN